MAAAGRVVRPLREPRVVIERWIVAEVNKNWHDGQSDTVWLLSQLFEQLINTNWERGYQPSSWQIHRVMVSELEMSETIIAIFERRPS
jgi:hypothetical protein